jgi:hypothetical protein
MIIGLRIYKVQLYRDHNVCALGEGGGPEDLPGFFRSFLQAYSSSAIDDSAAKKNVRFEPKPDDGHSQHGLMWYGSYGYGTRVVDVPTGATTHQRTPNEADTIKLYYRIWMMPSYNFGLLAMQSFGGRSCAEMVLREMTSKHSSQWPDYRLTASKLMPNDIKLYGSKLVKRVKLVKRKAPKSLVQEALRPEGGTDEIDIEFYLKARGNGTFGRLKNLSDRLGGHLKVSGIDYEQAFAEVKVGDNYKKIGVLGASQLAGVIDISDEISRDAEQHPTFESVSGACKKHMVDFSKLLGK